MASVQTTPRFFDEIAEFLASGPSAEQLLEYSPSEEVQKRARELMRKLKDESLGNEERWELEQFEYLERLMGLVKAKAHAKKATA